MALVATQSVSYGALTTPSPITPTASDTIAEASFGTDGVVIRIITTGTATTFGIADPGYSPMGNVGTAPALTCPATGVRKTMIPRSAINALTQLATITFTGALTGVTYELDRA